MRKTRFIAFNKRVFISTLLLLTCLTAFCLVAAGAEDEGTGGGGIFSKTGAHIYLVLRYPSHVLFKDFISGFPVFIIMLLMNCCLYAVLIERIYSFVRNKYQGTY